MYRNSSYVLSVPVALKVEKEDEEDEQGRQSVSQTRWRSEGDAQPLLHRGVHIAHDRAILGVDDDVLGMRRGRQDGKQHHTHGSDSGLQKRAKWCAFLMDASKSGDLNA
jgi:hypothetical protein